MLIWDKANIPHKGWEYIGIEDLGEDKCSGEPITYERCEMCGNEKIRYVHILWHPDYDEEIRVGRICASKMTNDYVTPKAREKSLKNRVNRRKKFMEQKWTLNTNSNYTLRYKGYQITIAKSKFDTSWGVYIKDKKVWNYQGKKITDLDTARSIAFNLFDEIYESHH